MTDMQIQKEIRMAIKQADIEKVKSLFGSNPSLLNTTTVFGTWLHVAASFGVLDIVKRLVEMGADVNAYGGVAGGGALHRAASDGYYETVLYLIESGAVLDVSEPERNPLFGAIHNGHTSIAKLLIDSGIDTKIKYSGKNMKDMDAIAFAREWGRKDIVDYLLKIS